MPSTQLLTDSTARCVDAMHFLHADRVSTPAGRSDTVEIVDTDTCGVPKLGRALAAGVLIAAGP